MTIISRNIGFNWQSYVECVVRICGQQTIDDVAEISVSAFEPQKPINGLGCIHLLKLNHKLRYFLRSLCTLNSKVLTFKIATY